MPADATRIENRIKDILNATTTWGGAIADGKRLADSITAARIESGLEVLRAISRNPKHGYYGSLATLVSVAHNAFLPVHDGEPGIPVIIPFTGGVGFEGLPADPNQIDSYRAHPEFYTGASDGLSVAHDAKDANDKPSAIACRYSIVNGRFKFTGLSAQVPLIQLTRTMADTGIPDVYEPTVIKLSIGRLLKEGDNLGPIADRFTQLGYADLAQIEKGSMVIPPVPDISMAQKAGVL